ncbi:MULTISPECIES: zinc ABC transporter substrate-binding protein [unclassified Thioalkalivibrio]|uniref:zinc ABC transporter substrate-binding protein n=1 Tax=unclassified Thioalkalivibrio TaxID=2621013 RepID=UPI00035CD7BD|nr:MULTISPECIES: zinc ABC transporter substrate-binding protein [unclassified Thioalkalivibrio]
MHSRPCHPFGISLTVSLLAILGLLLPGMAAADKPRIVATILPIHSIVAALGEDAFDVELLVPATASPHGYSMRPSEARRLQNADMVVWVGPDLETFLERPLRSAGSREIISLMDDLDLDLKPTREGGVWEHHHDHGDDDHGHDDHDHDHNGHGHSHDDGHSDDNHGHNGHGHNHDHGHHDEAHGHDHDHHHGDYDAHIWLSPAVVRAITEQLADKLMQWDPERAETVEANRDALLERIDDLDGRLAEQLGPVRDQAFIVFHDAYQYFEQHYGLNAAGSISIDPSRSPGPRRISELRERVANGDVVCLFTEPQFRPALAETVAEGTDTRLGVLDPVGAELEPGPDAWFELMQNMADGFADCLRKE